VIVGGMSSPRVRTSRLVTPRLVVRCWQPADAPLLKSAIDASLDHLRAWMTWAMSEPSDLPAIEARLSRLRDQFLEGQSWLYGIFDPAEREVVGGLGVHRRADPTLVEIGYWLRVDRTGRGYAAEAVNAVTAIAFEELGVDRVEIRCDPRNLRSAGVPRRIGYRHTHTIESDATTPDGQPRDTMVWELTRTAHRDVTARGAR
jgi:RimJ/RimL family protein N-acetyltransferase